MRLKNLFWLFVFFLTLAGIGLLMGLRSYRVFTHVELVAAVRCQTAGQGSPRGFVLWVVPVVKGMPHPAKRFPMQGDQWAIGGDFLKWYPWVNWFGVKNCHKLTRLSSRYLKAEDELNRPRTAYDLNGGTDLLWQCLYRVSQWIPFVEAVYGNSAYIPATPGQWGLYVTLSGYLLKPLKSR